MEGTDARKRRLQAMRQQAEAASGGATSSRGQEVVSSTSSADQAQEVDGAANKKIKFRNYQPYDSVLKAANSDTAMVGEPSVLPSNNADCDENAPTSRSAMELPPPSGTTQPSASQQPVDVIQAELEKLHDVEANIIPKKINWDLKEQVAGKLDKLKRRTQRAIVDILKEKIAAEEAGDLD